MKKKRQHKPEPTTTKQPPLTAQPRADLVDCTQDELANASRIFNHVSRGPFTTGAQTPTRIFDPRNDDDGSDDA